MMDYKPNEDLCIKKILCGNGYTIIAEVDKESYQPLDGHKYSKLIYKMDDKIPVPTSEKKVLLTGAEENVIVTTLNEK